MISPSSNLASRQRLWIFFINYLAIYTGLIGLVEQIAPISESYLSLKQAWLLGYIAWREGSIFIFLNSNPHAILNKGSISANLIIGVSEGEFTRLWC